MEVEAAKGGKKTLISSRDAPFSNLILIPERLQTVFQKLLGLLALFQKCDVKREIVRKIEYNINFLRDFEIWECQEKNNNNPRTFK